MNYLSKHKEGFIITIIFHLILVFILLRFGFFTPLPLPEEKGVLIDFGTSMQGMGENEPSPKEAPPVVAKKQPTLPPAKPKVAEPDVAKDAAMTQDYEKTAALEEARKKEDEARKKKMAEDKRKRDSLQRINDERIAEMNRLAEIRRQDSIRKAAENAKIDQINSRAKNLFGGSSGQGTDNSSTGEGITYQPGNQGSPDGTAGAKQYGNGGSGNGGISFSLTGRSAKSLPKPGYPGNEEGIVVVEITVDKYGKVTKAVPGAKGSNTMNQGLFEAARKAALSTTFSQNLDAPAFQTGTITYKFVLD